MKRPGLSAATGAAAAATEAPALREAPPAVTDSPPIVVSGDGSSSDEPPPGFQLTVVHVSVTVADYISRPESQSRQNLPQKENHVGPEPKVNGHLNLKLANRLTPVSPSP